MPNHLISIHHLSLIFTHKVCFEDFSASIHPGDRIGIIGRNGSGKSSLLNMLQKKAMPSSGQINGLENLTVAHVPQIPPVQYELSGGQIFKRLFSESLASRPDVLLLDEPSNHLDREGRSFLVNKLHSFHGTLVIVSHDVELLDSCADMIWHIDNGGITVFHGSYSDYDAEQKKRLSNQTKLLETLHKEKRKLRQSQSRLAERKQKSAKRKPRDNNTMSYDYRTDHAQAKTDSALVKFREQQEKINTDIRQNRLIEFPEPNFIIKPGRTGTGSIVSISSGWCGFDSPVLSDISLSLEEGGKIALLGGNGSGKTTLFKALLNDQAVSRGGDWVMPSPRDIGYLDQHYGTLCDNKNAMETIRDANPALSPADIRKHLNSFLFRKNEEVFEPVRHLSGGEKARLSLAQIAANPPRLLLLDEVTNNVDLETKQYIAQILNRYPGSFMIISHEEHFLNQLPLEARFSAREGRLSHVP